MKASGMEIVALDRGEGKTARAIEIAAERSAYLVVLNQREADRVFRIAKEAGKDIPYPITFDDFLQHRFFGSGVRAFVVDNADELIRHIARGVPIAAVTMTSGARKGGEGA